MFHFKKFFEYIRRNLESWDLRKRWKKKKVIAYYSKWKVFVTSKTGFFSTAAHILRWLVLIFGVFLFITLLEVLHFYFCHGNLPKTCNQSVFKNEQKLLRIWRWIQKSELMSTFSGHESAYPQKKLKFMNKKQNSVKG